MKFNKWILALSVCLLFCTISAIAQPQGGPGKGPKENPIEKYKAELNLTADQETQLNEIFTKYRSEFETLREVHFEDPDDRRAQMQEIRKAQRTEIQAVLTDEQQAILKEKMDADRANRKGKKKQ